MKPGNRVRAPTTDWTGQTLFGKWTVERLIGVGGTSTVLQARHRNGRRAALKILHPHLAAHGRMRERFLREGRLANLVHHPGVVSVLDDFVTDDGHAVLVLELVVGNTLATLAKESGGTLEPNEVIAAACSVLEVLAVAHDANVVHRDLKPENILRCGDGTYKLADFGLAALCHELGMLTGTNATLGTPAYMSPEQARGDTHYVDVRTDIWGLGATMFTLLTGRYLHQGSVSKNLVVAAATESAPAILSIEPTMHPPLAELIDRALRVNKEERWPNARAMLAELTAIHVPHSEVRRRPTTSLGDDAMPTAPSSFVSRVRMSSWLERTNVYSKRHLVGVSLAVAALAVGVTYWSSRAPGAPETPGDVAAAAQRVDTGSAENLAALVAAPPPPVSPSASSQPSSAAEPSALPPARRSPGAKARGSTNPAAVPAASSSARAPSPPKEPDLAVPDEVLDRRE